MRKFDGRIKETTDILEFDSILSEEFKEFKKDNEIVAQYYPQKDYLVKMSSGEYWAMPKEVVHKLYEFVGEEKKLSNQELCPFCGQESIIENIFVMQNCRKCGMAIMPCSICPDVDCGNCKFDKK